MYTQIYTPPKARDVVKKLMEEPMSAFFSVTPVPLELVAISIEQRKSYLLPDSDYYNMYADQRAYAESYFVA